jgi:hypothetical protein
LSKKTQYTQWLNENEERAYPLRETASKQAQDGTLLPNDLIVDLGLLVPPAHENVYFTSVRASAQSYIVALASPLSGLLIGTFRRSDVVPYTAYPLTPVISDVAGWISFGNHRPTGVQHYQFSGMADAGIELRAMRLVDALPVNRFVKFGGSPDYFADKITTFQGAGGLVFEMDPADVTGKTILVRLDDAHKFNFVGPCNEWADLDVCGVPPMRSFNGVCPDEDGRITLRFE